MTFRCNPLLENKECRIVTENYAVDVAQTEENVAIVNALKSVRLIILESDIDPSCIILVEWIICAFSFPPCLDTKLLLPCFNVCVELSPYFLLCFNDVNKHITDNTVKEHFKSYRCRSPESYHDGYDGRHFSLNDTQCVYLPDPS